MALVLLGWVAPLAGQEKQQDTSPPDAVRQFRDAVAFQDRALYDLAADEWQQFLKQFPSDPLAPKAQHYLGVCQLLQKQYDAAINSFQRVIRQHPDSELSDSSYLNLGLAQYSIAQAGQPESYDQAAKTFQTLRTRFPKSKELAPGLYYLGESLYARDKKQDAARAYEQLIKQYPQSPLLADCLYALGVARQDLGQTQPAGAAFDRFLKEFPRHKLRAEVIMRRAETLYSQKLFDAASRWFASAAASKNFKLADLAAVRQAQSLEAANKFAEAAALYAKIPNRFPESEYRQSALLAAGNCHLRSNDLDAAEEAYRGVIGGGGELADDAAHWLARALLKNDKPADALAVVEGVLPKSRGSDFSVHLLLDQADALYEIPARRGESIGRYAALAKKHSDHELAPQALYMAAFAALGQADYKAAATFCEQFLAAYADKPPAVDVRYVAAEAALQLKRYDQALARYAELAEKHPDHADVDLWKVRRGLVLHLRGEFDDVVASLAPIARSVEGSELTAEAQYLLGSAHGELGQHEPAAAALRASLAAAPQGKYADDALLALAGVQRRTNNTPQAIRTLERLLAEFPDSKLADQASYRAGEYALSAGDLTRAAKGYQRVVANWPDSPLLPHALYGLAWTRLADKQYPTATNVLNRLLKQFPRHAVSAKARYARALALEQQAEYAAAGQDLAAFLATNPPRSERSDALYLQGLCFAGLKQYDKAAAAFRSILSADPEFASTDKVLYEMAWALRSAEKPREALEAFASLARDHEDSPLAAESFYHLGEDAYQREDFAGAAAGYRASRAKAGATELGEKAAHKLGWSLYQQGELKSAAAAFKTQLADFPAGELAADAQFMMAEALFAQNDYDAAVSAYQNLFERAGRNEKHLALAHLHAGQALAQQENWSESFQVLDSAVGAYADSDYLPELRYESAWALQNLGKADEARARYEQVVFETDREVSARARFMIGEILFEKREYKEAIRNFFKVAYGYGYPESPDAMRVWQANASYEAGRCFEVLKMTNQAKKSYQEVVQRYPTSDKAALARKRLDALGG